MPALRFRVGVAADDAVGIRRMPTDTGLGARGAIWSGELTFPRATGFARAAEVAFWSGAQAASATGEEHLASAREAIRLFGGRLRPFGHDSEIHPGVPTVDAAGGARPPPDAGPRGR